MDFLTRFVSLNIRPNKEKEQTIKESASLFNSAKKSVKIVAGRLDSSFYHDERIIRALNNASSNGASVDIAVYPKENHGNFRAQLMERIPNAHVMALKSNPIRHWAVVDGKHVRVERKHDEGASETPAIICRNSHLLADEYLTTFERLTK